MPRKNPVEFSDAELKILVQAIIEDGGYPRTRNRDMYKKFAERSLLNGRAATAMMAAFEEQVVPFLTKLKFCDKAHVKKFLKFRSYPNPGLVDEDDSCDVEVLASKRKTEFLAPAAPSPRKKMNRIDTALEPSESCFSIADFLQGGTKTDSIGNSLLKDLERGLGRRAEEVVPDPENHLSCSDDDVFSLDAVLTSSREADKANRKKDSPNSKASAIQKEITPAKKLSTFKQTATKENQSLSKSTNKEVQIQPSPHVTQHVTFDIEQTASEILYSETTKTVQSERRSPTVLSNPMIAVGEDIEGNKRYFQLVPIAKEEVMALGACVPYKLT